MEIILKKMTLPFVWGTVLMMPSLLYAEKPSPIPAAIAQPNFDTGTYEAIVKNGPSDQNKVKIRMQIYPSNTYFSSIQEGGGINYSRGTWEQAGGYIILTENSKNAAEPILRLGLDKRWDRVASTQWAYTKDTQKAVAAWAEVEMRCPFWTEKYGDYGVGIPITLENRGKSKSIDMSTLEGIKKIADRQVSDALNQFFNTKPESPKWKIASDYVTESYNNQNAVYENLGRTLDAAGIEPFPLIRTVPEQCGAPDVAIPSASDYALKPNDDPEKDSLTNRDIPRGVVGAHIYDVDLGREAGGVKVTAKYGDGSMKENETNEYGWTFFDLPKGQKITTLKMQMQHDDGTELPSLSFSGIWDSSGVQDIHIDQIQMQRRGLGTITLGIDGDDLIWNIEGKTIRFTADPASQNIVE